MKRFHFVIVLLLSIRCSAQPAIEWQMNYGGTDDDEPYSIIETIDKGFAVAGITASNDFDVSGNHLGTCFGGTTCSDMFVLKLDSAGHIEWSKVFGGTNFDGAETIIQTLDSGFMVAGVTASNDGDVSGNHGGQSDCWLVKIDKHGLLEWQKCYGGSMYDEVKSIVQTNDSGFIFAGDTESDDGDVTGHHYGMDYWVVKIDQTGNLQWQKCLGGTAYDDVAYSIKQLSSGEYLVAGGSASIDGNVTGNHGSSDYWIVQLNSNGSIVWQKCYGGSAIDVACDIYPTFDVGGYIIVGKSESNDMDVSGNHGLIDIWVAKINSNHNILWQQSLGGTNFDEGMSVQQLPDSEYVVFGYTDSNNGNASGNHGQSDFWIIKLNGNGSIEWQKCLGGTDIDVGMSGHRTSDDGFILTGYSSSNNLDVVGNYGGEDFWVVKLAPLGTNIQINSPLSNFSTFLDNNLHFTLNSSAYCQSRLQLLDITGKVIFEQSVEIKIGFNKNEIQIPPLSPAVYLVRLKTDRGDITAKVVKQ